MEQNGVKSARLLEIYSRLSEGAVLKKSELAQDFHVTQRSIQRDIEDLRCFFAERHLEQDVIYDTKLRGYRLIQATPKGLSNSEILAVCKILLESRSMRKDEMLPILDKLIFCAVPESSQKAVKALIANEELHYVEPHHNRPILDGLWEIGQAIKNQQIIEIEYERMKEPRLVRRRVQPVGIMFSEYYFYLKAFVKGVRGYFSYYLRRFSLCFCLNNAFQSVLSSQTATMVKKHFDFIICFALLNHKNSIRFVFLRMVILGG